MIAIQLYLSTIRRDMLYQTTSANFISGIDRQISLDRPGLFRSRQTMGIAVGWANR
jgi:hypothetical protein